MFSNSPEHLRVHKVNARSIDEIEHIRKSFFLDFEKFVTESSAINFISSGEDILLLSINELHKLHYFLMKFFSTVTIIGYMRPPVSHMTSALQQRTVGGVSVKLDSLFPRYRDMFEKFDIVFGANNVSLKLFSQSSLQSGDVVHDFTAQCGLSLPEDRIVRSNTSKNLEAVSLLFTHRSLGRGVESYPRSPWDNSVLVKHISPIGVNKLALDYDFLKPTIEKNMEHIEWASQRIGEDILDIPNDSKEHTNKIHSFEDFHQISSTLMPQLLDAMKSYIGDEPVDPKIVAAAIDVFKDTIKDRRMSRKARREENLAKITKHAKNQNN